MGNQQQARGLEVPALGRALGQFLRDHKNHVMDCWQLSIGSTDPRQSFGRPPLVQHMPELMEQIATMSEDMCMGNVPALPITLADALACERLREGYDVTTVMHEYSVLRDCIAREWLKQRHRQHAAGLRVLHLTLDRVAAGALERYVQAQNRTLHALDCVASAALTSAGLADTMGRLLDVIYDTCAAVDTAAVLLREGDGLVVRASVGLESEVDNHTTIPIGQGFAGTVAERRAPMQLQEDEIRAIAVSPILRERGLKVLYGVPLEYDGELIGVSHIGSLRVPEFALLDKQIFAAMAYRATSGIAQHLLRERLREHNSRLETAKRVAEQIVGIVSHDLRTPIAAIRLNASAMLRQDPKPQAKVGLERIMMSTRRAELMITDLLDLTRARLGGGIPIRVSPTNLLDVTNQALGELRLVYPQRNFNLLFRGDLHGTWDADRLGQVMCNLLSNAAKYGHHEGCVTVELQGDEQQVAVSVHNDGTPIAPDNLPHLFEPLWRGHDGHTQRREGVGLGLFIVSSIVRAHGGRCDVTSSWEDGTTFVVKIPRHTTFKVLDSQAQSH